MRFISWASKSACVLLPWAEAVEVAEAVALEDVEGPLGVDDDEVLSTVAAALAVASFPMYLLKHTGDL